MGKITIKDVAREAGVSISTVSNAINDVKTLRPDTKAKVMEVVERLHYIPDLNGRNLKLKHTKTIGLFVASVKSPYFVKLADALSVACQMNNYELTIFVTGNTKSIMNNILGNRVDASIVGDNLLSEQDIQKMKDYEVSVLFLNNDVRDKKISSIIVDYIYEEKENDIDMLFNNQFEQLGLQAVEELLRLLNEEKEGQSDRIEIKINPNGI